MDYQKVAAVDVAIWIRKLAGRVRESNHSVRADAEITTMLNLAQRVENGEPWRREPARSAPKIVIDPKRSRSGIDLGDVADVDDTDDGHLDDTALRPTLSTIREKVEFVVNAYLLTDYGRLKEPHAVLIDLIATTIEAVCKTYDIERNRTRGDQERD